jgi:predicted Zn-dependent protease
MDHRCRRIARLLALTALLAGCATNPVTGRREFSLVSAAQEEQIGREGYTAVLAEYGTYEDPAVQRYVNEVGQKLAKVSQLPNLDWHFTVVDDPAVNAFAMPGGYIYITRGILAHLNSEAQLAGVLGHEIAHVTHRHSAAALTRQQVAGLGISVGSLLSSTFSRYGSVAQQGLGLLFLSYSRQNENEADASGIQYAAAAGYDPRDVPATYAMLKRVSQRSGQRLPGFLSTHPDPGDREVRTAGLASAAVAGRTGLLLRHKEYVSGLEGMVFGADPRQGYFEGDDFFHPGLGFTLHFPSGWTRENARAAVTAAAPEQRASLQLTLAAGGQLSPGAFVTQLEQNGRISGSRGGAETIGGFPAWVGRVYVPVEGGTPRTLAAAFIRRSPDQLFQILGGSTQTGDADLNQVLACARSFRGLTDPARLTPRPSKVRVTTLAAAGTFANAVAAAGAQGIDLEATAILNNRMAADALAKGELLKTVSPATLR